MRERVQRVPGESARSTPTLAPDIVHDVVRLAGKPLDDANRAFMESRFRQDFGNVRVHDDAKARSSLDAVDARAYAVGSHIVLGDARAARPSERQTLAHELAHVIQQRGAVAREALTVGDRDDSVERQADRVAHDVMGTESGANRQTVSASPSGLAVQRQPKGKQEPLGPYERMLVEHARHRLALLKQYVSDYAARQGRRGRVDAEIKTMGEKRAQMDIQGSNPFDADARRDMEAQGMDALNKRPLKVDVTDKQVTIRVRLHVRFESTKLESKFGDLKSSIQSAVETTWNQQLKGGVFGGRKFVVVPEVTKVGASDKRDQDAWLITVRPSDTAKVSYPSCTLDQPEPGSPTSVTDATCDGGVMSIPPAHVGRPDIIGHELMHLFGFMDRYRAVTMMDKNNKPHTRLDASRETGGRPDPLASAKGPVLVEDLSMLFDKLGVYELETTRGLDALYQLEQQGMKIGTVTAEIHRQEQIIATGRDPDGPEPHKKSFIGKMTDSMDDL